MPIRSPGSLLKWKYIKNPKINHNIAPKNSLHSWEYHRVIEIAEEAMHEPAQQFFKVCIAQGSQNVEQKAAFCFNQLFPSEHIMNIAV